MSSQDTQGYAKAIYILYLVSILVGITAVIGVVMAYINKGAAPDWLREHYRYQIRTFWMGLLFFFVSGLLAWVFIGYLTWLLTVVWLVIRCIKSMTRLDQQKMPDNPDTWLF